MNSPVQINRDPFARSTLMRERCGLGEATKCTNCGQTASRTGNPARPRLWYYYWEPDRVWSTPRPPQAKPFCNVECYREYELDR